MLALFNRVIWMHAIGILLILIRVGTILGPVGAVVVIYRNDLSQLVITPQIRDIMHGNSSIIPINNDSNDIGNSGVGDLMRPVFVSAQSNTETHTFTAIFNVTNTLNYDLTLNSFSTDVEITQDHIQAGSISLSKPIMVPAGETSQLTLSGSWTQAGQDYITNNYSSTSSVEVYILNAEVNVNGITIQSSGTIDVGNIPFSIVG